MGNLIKAITGGTESVFFLNIRSLRLHHDQLCVLVDSLKQKPLVIALCETWLTENDCLEMFQFEGYQKEVFTIREKRGGGVAFFVKTGVEFILQDLKSDLEYLAITVCSNLTKFKNCVVYGPPDHTCLNFWKVLILC